MTTDAKPILLAVAGPYGVQAGSGDAGADGRIDSGALFQLVRKAEHAGFELFLLSGCGPLTITTLAALAAVTDRIGLAGTVNPAYHEPYELARQLATLDHLSDGRAGWHVAAATQPRARSFLAATEQLTQSWQSDEVITDKHAGVFVTGSQAGRFEVHDEFFSIAGRFNVPRSPQGGPVIVQAGESSADRDCAAANAEVAFFRLGALPDAKECYRDLKNRLGRFGRSESDLLVLAATGFDLESVVGDNGQVLAGSAENVAGLIGELVQADGADGVILEPRDAGQFDQFVERVVPLLAANDGSGAGYLGSTLRERLGLAR
jgi:alkanesulfonate monooxygenase SsuD/methylene tetrahydromethanopterin reductase-like flavin-dependent oxidoreductase (luciferase family)